MARLDAVFFDVDGTLVDSERDGHRVAFNLAFEEAGLPDRWDVETYGRLVKVTGGARRMAAWFVENGMAEDEARDLGRRLHVRKTALMGGLIDDGLILAREGVEALIDRLEGAGVELHVGTTGTRAWVDPLLGSVFGDRFGAILTGTEVPALKPDPAVYLALLEQTGLSADRVVVVEDSANGVRAAVAAGLTVVVVTNGYTRDDDLTGAALVVDDFAAPVLAAWFDARLAG